MKKLSILLLIVVFALVITGCGEKIVYLPATTDTTIEQTTTTEAPTTTTTQAPTTTTESSIAQETAWLKNTAAPMCGFIWMISNIDAISQQLSPAEVQRVMELQVGIVADNPAPTQRTQELSDQFTRIVAPFWAAIKALNEGDQAGFDKAMAIIQSTEYQNEAYSFGQHLGEVAQDCGMANQVMDWMQNGVTEEMPMA
jgi:hypothetical protein